MRKFLTAVVVVGLVAGSVAAPAVAKKKKKKPVPVPVTTPVTFWFHNDPAACADENYTLQLVEATEGSNCGTALSGLGNEILAQAGDTPDALVYNATAGVPFVLDATQKITGSIQVASHSGAAQNPGSLGVGPTTLVLEIFGSVGGEVKSLGIVETDYVVTPAEKVHEVKFELAPPAEFDKATFESLSISLYNRGFAPLHGFYRVSNPASNFTVPTLQ